MTLKIAVCDDVAADRQRLVSLVKAEKPYCEITAYESGEALLWDFENGTRFDLSFLDIFMNGMSGVEAARHIHSADPDTLLVFVSSSNDFYREAYDLYAFNYLIKPLTQDKLAEVLHRAMERLNKDKEQVVRISFNDNLHTVRCSQLLYLSSEQHVINFHLKNGETVKAYGKMDDFITQLPSKFFVRCHQSYIVNLNYVTKMTASEFALDGIRIPVSRNYSEQAWEKYQAQMFGDF
jgi:DNA-binding LytR/AlgR family response regulator